MGGLRGNEISGDIQALAIRAFCRVGIRQVSDEAAVGLQMEGPGRARAILNGAERGISYDSFHEIRDEIHHGRGEDQPSSQEALI
jgi:hypothetical protein